MDPLRNELTCRDSDSDRFEAGLIRHRRMFDLKNDVPDEMVRAFATAMESMADIVNTVGEGADLRMVVDIHLTEHPDPLSMDTYEIVGLEG